VFKRSRCGSSLRLEAELLGDSGFQGVKAFHEHSRTPHKRSKRKPLTDEQRAFNRVLSEDRVVVETVIRRLKIFRVLKEVYRHRRRRFGLRVSLIAGLCNLDLRFGS
jgi:transposase